MSQVVYKPAQVREMLGGVSQSTYYELVAKGLLAYTRLAPGGDRVHTRAHIDEYLDYLARQTKGGERLRKQSGATACS